MNKVLTSNINVYKNYKYAPYTVPSALSEVIDNSLNIFRESNKLGDQSFIIIYLNIDEKWLQVMDNGPGVVTHPFLKHIWLSLDCDKPLFKNLISSSFFLGKQVTIESKNSEIGIKTIHSVDSTNTEEQIDVYKSADIMRTFATGTRVTIDGLYRDIGLNDIHQIYNDLSFIFKDVIEESKVNIIFAAIKNGTIYDPSAISPQAVNNVAAVNKLQFKLPEYNHTKTVMFNDTLSLSDKQIKISGTAYQMLINKTMAGISISNNKRVILGLQQFYKPDWFNQDFSNVYVDVKINGLATDLFNTKFDLSNEDFQLINEYIKDQISSIKIVLPKTMTKPLIDSTDDKYKPKSATTELEDWNKTKEFLTRAFMETGKIDNIDDFEIIKDKLRFTYNADDGKKITINLIKSKQKDIKEDWLQLIPIAEEPIEQIYEYDLKVNLNHPYFVEFMNNNELSRKLEHFFICYAIAESITRLDGQPVTQLKYEINKLLRGNNGQ